MSSGSATSISGLREVEGEEETEMTLGASSVSFWSWRLGSGSWGSARLLWEDTGDFMLMVTLLAGRPESEASSISEAGATEAVREVPSNDKDGLTPLPLSRRGRLRVD